jgi:type I restriction enzyme R subunit
VGGKILGIVEAKKLTLGPQNVLIQAERYSKGLLDSPFTFRDFRVPFLYSTNGEVIWHHDIRHELNRSREIQGFHTPDALLECFARDFEGALAKLTILPNDHAKILARPYQGEANAEIEKAIGARKRQMLLAMATGTGKTFMTASARRSTKKRMRFATPDFMSRPAKTRYWTKHSSKGLRRI